MPFQLVHYSQQDPQWKTDILGFGDPGDTIGYVGCALTATAMLLSGHGYAETPKTLNEKLKSVNGFISAAIMWSAVSKLYPKVTLKAFIPCAGSDAPLAQIDAALAAGQPALVQVDSSPASGIQTHWVVIYQRQGNDYLMLDPWPHQTDVSKPDLLMQRYAQGRSLHRAISHVILYEAFGSTTPPTQPQPAPFPLSGPTARVKAEVTWGLNLRSSIDTATISNVVAVLPAGTYLQLLDADGYERVGAVNQMLRVRTVSQEGFVAAWLLEKVSAGNPPVETETTSGSSEAPVSTPVTPPVTTTPSSPPPIETQPNPVPPPPPVETQPVPASSTPPAETTPEPPRDEKLIVFVSSAVGSAGLRLRQAPSKGGALVLVLKAGTRLTVTEPAAKARAKVARVNQWIAVREPGGKRGYVSAEFVRLP